MKDRKKIDGYLYTDAASSSSHTYLIPAIRKELDRLARQNPDRRLFDLGCGNGSVAASLSCDGWAVTGVDPSADGIRQGRTAYPNLRLEQASAYDNLLDTFGQVPVVISLEVVEHVYAPRDYAKTLFDLLEPGGTALISTPYHGYAKNLAMALAGKLDAHFTALWDHGHIKFWSFKTLSKLLLETGFRDVRFLRVGRIPPLAKSMIAIAKK